MYYLFAKTGFILNLLKFKTDMVIKSEETFSDCIKSTHGNVYKKIIVLFVAVKSFNTVKSQYGHFIIGNEWNNNVTSAHVFNEFIRR